MIIRTSRSHGPSLARHHEASRSDCANRIAAQVIDQAHDEAAEIIAQAKQQAAAMTSQLEQSLAQQHAKQEQLLHDELAAAKCVLAGLVTEMASQREHSVGQLHVESLELALAIAARILRTELHYDSRLAVELTREALAMMTSTSKMTVFVHPDDLTAFRQPLEQLLSDANAPPECLVADPAMSRGGCRVETERGMIDQSVETQLDRIAEELLNGK